MSLHKTWAYPEHKQQRNVSRLCLPQCFFPLLANPFYQHYQVKQPRSTGPPCGHILVSKHYGTHAAFFCVCGVATRTTRSGKAGRLMGSNYIPSEWTAVGYQTTSFPREISLSLKLIGSELPFMDCSNDLQMRNSHSNKLETVKYYLNSAVTTKKK